MPESAKIEYTGYFFRKRHEIIEADIICELEFKMKQEIKRLRHLVFDQVIILVALLAAYLFLCAINVGNNIFAAGFMAMLFIPLSFPFLRWGMVTYDRYNAWIKELEEVTFACDLFEQDMLAFP